MKHPAQRALMASLCLPPALAFGFGGLDAGFPAAHDAVTSFFHHPVAVASASGTLPTPTLDILSGYKDLLASHPLYTKMATGATLATAGDAIAQSREDGSYDKRRAGSFMAFDASYRALQHALFPPIVRVCDGHFLMSVAAAVPPLAQLVSDSDAFYFGAVEQTLASQLGIVPFLYYPVFYALTGYIQGLTVDGALERARETFIPLMKRNLLFWIPVQFIQFGFIEENMQIPFLSICGLAWTFILSIMAGSTKNYTETHDDDYCVTGLESQCELPEDLFPNENLIAGLNQNDKAELDRLVQASIDKDSKDSQEKYGNEIKEKTFS